LAETARRKGQALGIGHCRQSTLHVLEEEIPKLIDDGFDFVFVSQLVK
jgi:polysaccharide deacetylase 2 family uncharacterized protein YibQ